MTSVTYFSMPVIYARKTFTKPVTGVRCPGRLPGPAGSGRQERGGQPDGDHRAEAQDQVCHPGEGEEPGRVVELHRRRLRSNER